MSATIAQRWADLRRWGGLGLRHLRFAAAPFSSPLRQARTDELADMFRAVNAWLEATGVEYVITYGTLLGWQREGAILAHDRDIDFGLPADSFPAVWAARAALPPGYRLRDTSHRHGGPKLYVSYRGWEADLYFFREEGERLQTILVSDIPSDTIPFPRAWFYPRSAAVFLGVSTFVPHEPIAYLTHLYGYIGPNAVRDPATGYFKPRHPAGSPES